MGTSSSASFKEAPPPRRKVSMSIAVPASILEVEPTLLAKTLKVGVVARAAAIHRVDEVVVYQDKPGTEKDLELAVEILEYLSLSPYLRRKYFPKRPTLRYVGALPPLRTPGHVKETTIKVGEYREALIHRRGNRLYADVGVGKSIPLKGRHKEGVAIVRIIEEKGRKIAVPVNREKLGFYWGFSIAWAESLREVLEEDWDLKVATSRWGDPIFKVHKQLSDDYKRSRRTLVAFGSPTEGLWEIAGRQGITLDQEFDYIVNFIPDQGVETVRTEEAIHAVLEYFTLVEAETL